MLKDAAEKIQERMDSEAGTLVLWVNISKISGCDLVGFIDCINCDCDPTEVSL